MKQNIIAILAMGAVTAVPHGHARADVVLSGPDSNDGSYSTAALQAIATGADTVTSGGNTGISIWGLMGGSTTGTSVTNPDGSNSTTYGGIDTTTPANMNSKNAILRYYLVGISGSGQQSVVSLGEIDPFFGGTSATPAFIAYQGGGGLLTSPTLIVPGQPGRTLGNLTGLELLSVPALPNPGEGILSSAVTLSGNVANPGSYSLAKLQSNFAEAQATAGGDLYTGLPLWTFLNQSSSSPTSQIVIAQATDGYEAVVALGELDPSDGGNPNDLLAYADTGTAFPGDGVARLTFPGDNHAGRYVSNLDAMIVEDAIPEPATLTLFGTAILALVALRRRFNVIPRQI